MYSTVLICLGHFFIVQIIFFNFAVPSFDLYSSQCGVVQVIVLMLVGICFLHSVYIVQQAEYVSGW